MYVVALMLGAKVFTVKPDLMVMNSFSLVGETFITPSVLNDSHAVYSVFLVAGFFFSAL